MRQSLDRQKESFAHSDSDPGKCVANIFRHRSSSKRGHELPPLLNDNKVFVDDDTDKAEGRLSHRRQSALQSSAIMQSGQYLVHILLLAGSLHGHFGCARRWDNWDATQGDGFCRNPGKVSIAGGSQNRMVTEGGRIVLTCCLPGNVSGHDHEQLVWTNPKGHLIINYFSNAGQASQSKAYAVPDFTEKNRLMTRLVVRRFSEADAGNYKCSKGSDNGVLSDKVYLMMRPRLLADFPALEHVEEDDSGASSVVTGHRVSVPLEEDTEGRLVCRTNPNFSGPIRVTWFYHGRQLIGPAAALLDEVENLGDRTGPGFLSADTTSRQRQSFVPGLERPTGASPKPPKKYIDAMFQPVVIDPAELGVAIENDSQVLFFPKLHMRHAGMYMCKAEALNPVYKPKSNYQNEIYSHGDGPDWDGEKSGVVESEFLVQVQPIRLIVFSRPHMLPGNPRLISLPTPAQLRSTTYFPELLKRSQDQFQPTLGRYSYQRHFGDDIQRQRRSPTASTDPNLPFDDSGTAPGQLPVWHYNNRPVAKEGEQMVLECAARGNPPPKLSWYRGGGTSLPPPEDVTYANLNFDKLIREALPYLPLEEAKRYLGTAVAEGSEILPAIEETVRRPGERPEVRKLEVDNLSPREVDFSGTRLGRFSVVAGLRKDDSGIPVIAVSRLIIDQLQVTDATRYTCLAQLDMAPLGGHGNWTDVGSTLPAIVMHPQFIAAGTKLYATGYPSENATLSCEAFGGLSIPGGLQLRLLRGPGLKELAEYNSLKSAQINRRPSMQDALLGSPPHGVSPSPASSSTFYNPPNYPSSGVESTEENRLLDSRVAQQRLGDRIEVIRPGMDPRYHLTAGPDPKNPYAAQIRLTISDLRPEDNNYYACEAESGSNWVALAPPPDEALGRLTVWFAPPSAGPPIQRNPDTGELISGDIMYGLAHRPSRLECRALGQPQPQWTWTGPAIRKTLPPASAGQTIESDGYVVRVHQEGEESVSELTLPAAYWNYGIFGSYACTATNRLGSSTGYVRLKLATHPHRPNVTACTVEATLVELCVIPPHETGGLPLTHYELRIQPHPKDRFHGPFAYLPGRRVVRLPDLTPNHFYRFALSAVTPAGRGPNTYLQVTTLKIGKPRLRLVASDRDVSTSDYTVRWELETDGGSPVILYTIKIRPIMTYWGAGQTESTPLAAWTEFDKIPSARTDSVTPRGVEGIFKITGLQPGTAYEVSLVGQNSVGQSDPYVVLFRTSEIRGASGRLLGEPVSQHLHGEATALRANGCSSILLASLLVFLISAV
ncbi:hypothetical protein SprV_0501806000 [Sparganum proliferum]